MSEHSINKSFGFAMSGIIHAATRNRNIKIHFFIGVIAIVLGMLLGLTRNEMIVIFMFTLIVLSAEMVNSAIEEMTNLITTEHRQEAKIAKDVGAGMVLVSAIGAAIIGAIIFIPYILRLFNTA